MNMQDRSNTFDLNKYGVGQPVRRTEDPVLVQGQGRYTDDVSLAGEAHAVFVRSRHGHGIIKGIDTSAAKAMPGVLAIYTGADLSAYGPTRCVSSAIRSRSWSPKRWRRRRTQPKPWKPTSSLYPPSRARARPQSPEHRSSMTTCRGTSRSTISMAIPKRSRMHSPRPRTS